MPIRIRVFYYLKILLGRVVVRFSFQELEYMSLGRFGLN